MLFARKMAGSLSQNSSSGSSHQQFKFLLPTTMSSTIAIQRPFYNWLMERFKAAHVCLLIAITHSLTFNLDDTSAQAPAVLIFRHSKPSVLIFPSNQTITLNYPHRQEYTRFQLVAAEPTITFSSLSQLGEKGVKETEVFSSTKVKKSRGQAKANFKKQLQNQIQLFGEKQVPKNPKLQQQQGNYPSLIGTYQLQPESLALEATIPIAINATHLSYTVCSLNSCLYRQEKGKVEFGSCQIVPRQGCAAFGDLFYAEMHLLAQLRLIQSFRYSPEHRMYHFYDKESTLRLQLSKNN